MTTLINLQQHAAVRHVRSTAAHEIDADFLTQADILTFGYPSIHL